MIVSSPWTGWGIGSFEAVYPAFARFDVGSVVDHAHNDWLEWTSDAGIPFAAGTLLLVCFGIPTAIRSVWGIGIPAILCHSLVDYPLHKFPLLALTSLLFCLLPFKWQSSSEHSDRFPFELGRSE
jgi:O-antigen ligase